MTAKIIAFYLPQFHAIPENDSWWGKGFTDWINVKKARPLFNGHQQPKIPQGDNYYDLSSPETIRWQAQLANKYNIYGFCFYHYWFNGKLLLEKPAELLLRHPDIPLRFCFSWANEPWARTWDGKSHQILINQEYGNEDDWVKHFDYLLPFFKDERYIKENGRPIMLIYKSQAIHCAKEMMDCWNQLAIKAGFPGLHFVETLRTRHQDSRNLPFAARMEFEPARAQMYQSLWKLNYDRIRRRIVKALNAVFGTSIPNNRPQSFGQIARLSLKTLSPEGTYGGVFMGWDNTPRKGLAGNVIFPPTKQEFKDYLTEKLAITTEIYKTNYIFVNAWNEWAEGTVLEPDKANGYSYLKAIQEVLCKKNSK